MDIWIVARWRAYWAPTYGFYSTIQIIGVPLFMESALHFRSCRRSGLGFRAGMEWGQQFLGPLYGDYFGIAIRIQSLLNPKP